jgi:HemY protein
MRWLISLLIVIVLAVGLALAGRYDPGYVVLVYPPWRIEVSFITFVLLLAGFVVGAYALTRLALVTLRLPQLVRAARARRDAERQDANFTGGLRAYVEGRFQDAEQGLGGWQGDSARLGLARVLAARAAQEIRAEARRRSHLAAAAEHGSELAAHLAEAEYCLGARDVAGALTAIAAGKLIAPQHTALLRLELGARQQAGQWDEVLKLIERLLRANALDSLYATQLRRAAHIETLKRVGLDERALLELWKQLPDEQRSDALLARAGARAFIANGGMDTALDILEAALKRDWHEDLVALYGKVRSSSPTRQIEQAEKWLVTQPRDAHLLLALAELCSVQELWGKAQSYLEASLAIAPSAEAHLRLAELREHTGQLGEACQHYQSALALCRTEHVLNQPV